MELLETRVLLRPIRHPALRSDRGQQRSWQRSERRQRSALALGALGASYATLGQRRRPRRCATIEESLAADPWRQGKASAGAVL